MGAGIDGYNSYVQRGSLHVIEHQLAAALELFPVFAHARVLRTWAGIVDVCPDASPIVGPTPVDELYLNCGWGTGGFKATPGVGPHVRVDDRQRPSSRAERAVLARPLHHRRADRRARRRGGGALMLLDPLSLVRGARRDRVPYGAQAKVAYPEDPRRSPTPSGLGSCSCAPTRGARCASAGCTCRAAAAGSTSCATRRRTSSRAVRFPRSTASSTRGARPGDTLAAALVRERRRSAASAASTATGRVASSRRRAGAERPRPGRGGATAAGDAGRARGRPRGDAARGEGTARRRADGRASTRCTRTATSSSSAAGRSGVAAAAAAARTGHPARRTGAPGDARVLSQDDRRRASTRATTRSRRARPPPLAHPREDGSCLRPARSSAPRSSRTTTGPA